MQCSEEKKKAQVVRFSALGETETEGVFQPVLLYQLQVLSERTARIEGALFYSNSSEYSVVVATVNRCGGEIIIFVPMRQ